MRHGRDLKLRMGYEHNFGKLTSHLDLAPICRPGSPIPFTYYGNVVGQHSCVANWLDHFFSRCQDPQPCHLGLAPKKSTKGARHSLPDPVNRSFCPKHRPRLIDMMQLRSQLLQVALSWYVVIGQTCTVAEGPHTITNAQPQSQKPCSWSVRSS